MLGRAKEVALLLSSLARVATNKTLEVVFVSGYSLIGKTALVGELAHASPRGKAALVQGKFDQFSRDTPFRGIIMAMQVRGLQAGRRISTCSL